MKNEVAIPAWKKRAAIGNLWIRCLECGKEVEVLTKNHLRTHGMTKEEYIRRHPEHADIYYWGNVPNNKSSKQAHRRAGGTCAWNEEGSRG